ncbi:MAG: phage resistance protein, partial [Betaproteobacteria bacterium]
ELELKEQALPNDTDWQAALHRASSLFGLTLGETLNAANVGKLVDEVRQKAAAKNETVGRLVSQVRDRSARYAPGVLGPRQQTAESAQALLASLAHAEEGDIVTTLAAANLQTSEAAVGRSLGQAQTCADALGSGNWQLFDVVSDLSDHRREAALAIMSRLTEALTSDEHVVALKPRLEELARDAMRLLAAASPPVTAGTPVSLPPGAAPMPAPVTMPPVPLANGSEIVDERQQLHLSGTEALAALDDLKARVTSERDLELTLSWRLQRKGTQL